MSAINTAVDNAAIINAMNRSQAVIEFNPDGNILNANAKFLAIMGYDRDELVGRHHSIFVEDGEQKSTTYLDFWHRLARGEYVQAEFRRLAKGGKEIWLHGSYNPVADAAGRIYKVVKFATDVTTDKLKNADFLGQISAISKSLAVIEFALDGTILKANENFLGTFGYSASEVEGRHHSMFVEPGHERSREYNDFWAKLNCGEYQAAQYKRIAKDRREVWIEATYNPIFDLNGKPFKVVKFATDVTAEKLRNANVSGQINALDKSLAVIEFALDGTILRANGNFLKTFDYTLSEVEGHHHSMFVEPDYAAGSEYRQFWTKLNHGTFQSAQYKRIANGGREVWIEATYNPIFDLNGKPFKVVKFATDITEQINRRQAAIALQQSRNFLQATVDALSSHIAILDETGTIIAVNDVWKKFAEKNHYNGPEFGIGANYLRVTECATGECASEARMVGSSIREVIAGERLEVLVEYPCHTPTEQHWFVARITRFKWDGPVRVVVSHEDITPRKLAEQSLQASEERWKFAIEGSQDGMWDWNLINDCLENSARLLEIIELPELRDAPFHKLKKIVHPNDVEEFSNAMQLALAGQTPLFSCEYRVRCKDEGWKWILTRGMVVRRTDAGAPLRMVGTVTDITPRKKMEEDLRIAARIDKLTGLPNRALLLDWLQKTISRYHRFKDRGYALMFLDFDRFKMVNDTLGHEAGDELLCQIARRLETAVRAIDTVSRDLGENAASRLGGDEFVVLLSDIKCEADASIVAERILSKLSAPYIVAGQEIVSTASIGLVSGTSHYLHAEDVLRDADTAMYEAKAAGKGRIAVFDESMRVRVQRKADLEGGLRRALDEGQLLLHYQPIICIETGRIEGLEALIRWAHPEHGMISPGEFIPVAEESGIIIPIGEWVVRQACRQIVSWHALLGVANVPPVSVNISRSQLLLNNLPKILSNIVSTSGLSPSSIHFEVTESGLVSNMAQAIRILQEIKTLGFEVYMDDFGTGHSSLSSLDQFPIDVLKIDRSFINNMSKGRKFAAMVNVIAELARNLNIRIIAEGVETAQQFDLLRSMNCHSAQGYLISKPLPADRVPDYLTTLAG